MHTNTLQQLMEEILKYTFNKLSEVPDKYTTDHELLLGCIEVLINSEMALVGWAKEMREEDLEEKEMQQVEEFARSAMATLSNSFVTGLQQSLLQTKSVRSTAAEFQSALKESFSIISSLVEEKKEHAAGGVH